MIRRGCQVLLAAMLAAVLASGSFAALAAPRNPGIPSGVRASAAGSSTLRASWSTVKGAKVYQVYMATAAAGPYTLRLSTKSRSATLSGLNCKTRYYIRVAALGGKGTGELSSPASAVTRAGISAPATLSITVNNTPQARISWPKVKGAKSYAIYRRAGDSGEYVKIATSKLVSYTDNSLLPGVRCDYRVRAVNSNGEGYFSPIAARPAAPGGFCAPAVCFDSITLRWDAVAGATRYQLARADAPGGPYQTIATIYSTEYTVQDLAPDRDYFFVLTTTDAAGAGLQGQPLPVRTAIAYNAPTLQVAAATGSSLTLSWNASPGALSYTLYRAQADGSFAPIAQTEQTAYTDGGLDQGVACRYIVAAVGSTGEGRRSNAAEGAAWLPAPQNVTAEAADSSHITVSWSAVTAALRYQVTLRDADGQMLRQSTITGTGTTLTVDHSDCQYQVTVEAQSAKGGGASAITAVVVPLKAPGNLRVHTDNTKPSTLLVSWAAVDGAEYLVYWKSASLSQWNGPVHASGTSLLLDNLAYGAGYDIRVQTVGRYGGLTSDALQGTTPTLDWLRDAACDAQEEAVQQQSDWLSQLNQKKQDLFDRGLASSSLYTGLQQQKAVVEETLRQLADCRQAIEAANSDTLLNASIARIGSLQAGIVTAPQAPTGLNAQAGESGVLLSWDTLPGLSYTLLRQPADGGSWEVLREGLSQNSILVSAAVGVTWRYSVVAVSAGICSPLSAAVTATVPVPPLELQRQQVKTTMEAQIANLNTRITALDATILSLIRNGAGHDMQDAQRQLCVETIAFISSLSTQADSAETSADLQALAQQATNEYRLAMP